jgi:hypothetical protein
VAIQFTESATIQLNRALEFRLSVNGQNEPQMAILILRRRARFHELRHGDMESIELPLSPPLLAVEQEEDPQPQPMRWDELAMVVAAGEAPRRGQWEGIN